MRIQQDPHGLIILEGNDDANAGFRSVNEVTAPPKEFTQWVKDNQERIVRAKSLPYFLRDNGAIKNGEWRYSSRTYNEIPHYITAKEFEQLSKTMSLTDKKRYVLYDSDDLYIDSSWSRTINSELAKGKIGDIVPNNFMDKGSLKQVRVLDSVITKNTLPNDMWLYRKVSPYWLQREGIDFKVGNIINEYGFTSTSAVKGANVMRKGKDVLLEIHAPKGTNAFVSANSSESEVILPRNSKFKVLSVREENGNKIIRLGINNKVETYNTTKSGVSHLVELVSVSHKLDEKVTMLLDSFVSENVGEFKHNNIIFKQKAMGRYGAMAKTDFHLSDNRRVITLSSSEVEVNIHGRKVLFNPSKELEMAITAIKQGIPLTFAQEYSVEKVWHEMMHAGANIWKDFGKSGELIYISPMECVNQFCSRMSYDRLLRHLGITPRWKEEVLRHGMGYKDEVQNFMMLLDKFEIPTEKAYDYFKGKIRSVPYEDIRGYMIKFLSTAKKTPTSNIEKLVEALSLDEKDFSKAMGELLF